MPRVEKSGDKAKYIKNQPNYEKSRSSLLANSSQIVGETSNKQDELEKVAEPHEMGFSYDFDKSDIEEQLRSLSKRLDMQKHLLDKVNKCMKGLSFEDEEERLKTLENKNVGDILEKLEKENPHYITDLRSGVKSISIKTSTKGNNSQHDSGIGEFQKTVNETLAILKRIQSGKYESPDTDLDEENKSTIPGPSSVLKTLQGDASTSWNIRDAGTGRNEHAN